MRAVRHIFTVDSHTAGEPTRVVVGGLGPVPGKSMAEKKRYLAARCDDLRVMLMQEPRGHRDMFGAVLLPPCHPEADIGVVFMQSASYLDMCGHGSIGVVTTLLEMGMLPADGERADVVLDTPVGLVRASAELRDGHVGSVVVRNVPSFLYLDNVAVTVPEMGTLPISVAFGGNFFALADLGPLRLEITRDKIPLLVRAGMYLLDEVNRRLSVAHPELPDVNAVSLVEFYAPSPTPGADARNIVVFGDGQFDRSPCGTGTSAKLAMLYSRGRIGLGETYRNESVIGTTFLGRAVEETKVGQYRAIVPEIQGEAFITGMHQFVRHPDDPIGAGFLT